MCLPTGIMDIFCNQRNVFNFFPVGHGLFYAGSIDYKKFTFVYDCGTDISTSKSVDLTSQIKCLKEYLGGKVLDFVVLSHLHYDHYRGLEELFKEFEIKELILPYLGGEFSRETIFYMIYSDGYNNPKNYKTAVFEKLVNMGEQQRIIYASQDDFPRNYSFDNLPYWHFCFYLKQSCKSKIDQLNKEIERFIKDNPPYSKVSEVIKHGRTSDIRRIYESIFGKGNALNNTSVVLLHKPASQSKLICLKTSTPFVKTSCFDTNGETLLTGDCCFNKELASKLNINYPLAVLQVPHHGSAKNWKSIEKNFPSIQYSNAIITCSVFKLHNLPNKYTLDQIPCDKTVVVNERNSFSYSIITDPKK